jgi:penicillin-binding protein 2
VRGQYPPGSTIKPFIALTGLEYGVTTPEFSIFDPGWYQLKGDSHKYRDWKRWGHGLTNMRKAIVESCDTYFYDLGFKLGIDRMHEFLSGFSLGQETGIDMDEELPGLLPSRTWKRGARGQPWYPGETLITAIGQGFMLTTPLQLANATATLASRGRGMTPRLVHAIQDPDGETHLQPPRPHPPLALHNPANWEMVIAAMEAVVHSDRGTARRIGDGAPYSIAGKTGTAQVFGIKQDEKYVEEEVALRLRDHALFVGFAPVADPRIAVAVVVENGGHGGSVAAPLARAVMDYYMESLPQ